MPEEAVHRTADSRETQLTRLDIVPAGDAAEVCTASGRWLRVPMTADRLFELLGADVRESIPADEAAVMKRLRTRLLNEGSLRPAPIRPACLHATGEVDLCARLKRVDGSGLLSEMRVLDVADVRRVEAAADLTLFVTSDVERLVDPAVTRAMEGRVWLPCGITAGEFAIGPMNGGPYTVTVADLVGRLIGGNGRPDRISRRGAHRLGEWADEELAWVVAVLVLDVNRHLRGERPRCAEHQLVLNPQTMTISGHRVLPLPFRLDDPTAANPRRPGLTVSAEELVDARTGVITRLSRVQHHPSIPKTLITYQASITNVRRFSPWLTDPVAAGCSFTDEGAARGAAIGEAVERYSGEIIQSELLRRATWEELTAAGEHALDPQSLELFSARQYATPNFPFVPLTRDLKIHWVRGRCLSDDESAWLPASLIYPNWYTGTYEKDPHTNNPFYPGLAAGPSLDFAIASGIQEIIERDATMIWWANAHPLSAVRQPLELRALWAGIPTERGQRAWLIHLDNEFGVPVMAGMVENLREGLFTMGFAARPDPVEAARKAWAEALTLQDSCRDLLDPRGAYRRAVGQGDVNGRFVKPHRADRRYLDDYRSDLRDAVDLMCQLQMYLDPRAVERVRPWVDTPETRDMADLPRLADGSLETYRRVVEERGFRIYYADVTTGEVAATGMRVVRVLIPGMVPNFAAAFPFHGRGRLRNAAVERGWRSAPLAEDEINIFPIAHA